MKGEDGMEGKLGLAHVAMTLLIIALTAIPKDSAAQFSYEVYVTNRQDRVIEIEQICINSSTCSSGRLNPKQSIWLTRQSHSPEKRLVLTIRTNGRNQIIESCEISQPKSRCAYEILIKQDGGIVKSKDREDCIDF